MVGVSSLGTYVPSGVRFLIEEKILPEDPLPSMYHWETFDNPDEAGVTDEIVYVTSHVVWSRGDHVYRVFSFEIEKEPVQQALFASFMQQEIDPDVPPTSAVPAISVKKRAKQNAEAVSTSTLVGPNLQQSSKNHNNVPEAEEKGDRALVVVLKTHMQIFFLTGTRSIVPLGFGVDRVFALSEGLIVQRRSFHPAKSQSGVLPPKTPLNSFALSQSFVQSPEPLRLPAIVAGNEKESRLVKSLFKAALSDHESRQQANVPYHYYLPDPFTELGVIGQENAAIDTEHTADRQTEIPLQSERLIYVSSRNEITRHRKATVPDLCFVVSINIDKKQLNIWQLSKAKPFKYWKPRRRAVSYDTERRRKRRSSQPGTGTVTPNPRHSIGPRDSFVGVQDSFTARDQVKDDDDLAAKLDPAFQNPRAPGPSSRRISSMLARSDLTGMDMYTDGTIGQPSGPGLRRGPSMGAAGAVSRSFRQGPDRHHDLRSSMRSDHGLLDGGISTDEEESAESDSKKEFARLLSASKGLRVDYRMKHLQSVNIGTSLMHDNAVFVVPSASHSEADVALLLCVTSPQSGELLLFQIQAGLLSSSKPSVNVGWHSKIAAVRRIEKIIDACSFLDETETRLSVLSRAKDGSHEVSIYSTFAACVKLRMPDNLLINFPYSLRFTATPVNRRLTGAKRLIEDLPLPLTSINRGSYSNQLIVSDRTGERHRLFLKTKPENTFVQKCLEVCQIICQNSDIEQNVLLSAWTQVHEYSHGQGEVSPDTEWAAFTALLLMLCRPKSVPERTQVRVTRRKGGFLRSSSGATTDLTDFNSMMASESAPASAAPLWTENLAWDWLTTGNEADRLAPGLGLNLSPKSKKPVDQQGPRKASFIIECLAIARELGGKSVGQAIITTTYDALSLQLPPEGEIQVDLAPKVLVGLHMFREELKLNLASEHEVRQLTPILAQIGGWLGWRLWSWEPQSTYMAEDADLRMWLFDERTGPFSRQPPDQPLPPSILSHIALMRETGFTGQFPSIQDLCQLGDGVCARLEKLIPRLRDVTSLTKALRTSARTASESRKVVRQGNSSSIESLPEGIAAPFRSSLALLQSNPPSDCDAQMLQLLDRDDLGMLLRSESYVQPSSKHAQTAPTHTSTRDQHAICRSAGDEESGQIGKTDASAEIDRSAVTRMIFNEDQRVRDASKMLHPLEPPVVRCLKEAEWSEQEFLEAEQDLAKVVAVRTLSICAGRGLFLYGGRSPLLTERFPTHGFTLSCVMKPSNNNVTAEKETFTEEKVSWAFFHAGAEAGLSISKNSKGIDTSWIVFNKPHELNNRHAGFLLALGLNGHLKNIAKWVAFKYLTPKHTMTSVGLLLGLAASYIGTMDMLIVRLLSVHVTRMLPPGAAELNLSPLTQTTGILALGLLYCETQHRRMSEIMLSEMENTEQDDNDNPLDTLRDEGYRLAAGFSLGFINLGQGKSLRGLHDMHIVERLLALAVGTRRANLVHVLDKASAAATIATALIFMKSNDEALAKKIDIPDTTPQFEYVRPDLFLIRTIARHLIMWDKIQPSEQWLMAQLPPVFEKAGKLEAVLALDVKDLPLYDTIAGLCFAIGLRYAGTADVRARDVLVVYLDRFMHLARLPAIGFDHRLTRTTLRNCQDAIALAAACVMAGTGDIQILRRLRSLHGRIDAETPYGSHMAAHQAIGTLFLAGGTHTFKNTNLAIAALFCAFYPLFPTSVLDNKGHLQAFRHLWVLAAEPRCLIVRSADSHRPITMSVTLRLVDGSAVSANAPCLLPPLDRVSSVEFDDPRYWRVVLDLAGNAAHRAAFARHQSMFARRRGAGARDAATSAFSTAMQALADEDATATAAGAVSGAGAGQGRRQDAAIGSSLDWIFDLPAFADLGAAGRSVALPPPDVPLANHAGAKSSAVDDRLMLRLAMDSKRADRLWSLRILFGWADGVEREAGADGEGGKEAQIGWLERAVINGLRAELGVKMSQMETY